MKRSKKLSKEKNKKDYSISRLKVISKKWNKKEWNEYLDENVEVKQREINLKNSLIAERVTLDKDRKLFKRVYDPQERPYLKKVVRSSLNYLHEKERMVIEMIYWTGLTQAETARGLNTNEMNISRTHKRALKKLEGIILDLLSTTIPTQKLCHKYQSKLDKD